MQRWWIEEGSRILEAYGNVDPIAEAYMFQLGLDVPAQLSPGTEWIAHVL
ncbi:MAG TPA: hypothetical protein VF856_01615 [Gemmatimonadaceae bacterium]